MSKVVFDYSKASSFISEEEMSYMSRLVEDSSTNLEHIGNHFH